MALSRTLGTLIAEARTLLQDKEHVDGAYRYSDAELFEALNAAFMEARAKRPDLFILVGGLQNAWPMYDAATDMDVTFPLNPTVYSSMVYYVVGRTELREDTFSQDSRAVSMMNKFVSQLLGVAS